MKKAIVILGAIGLFITSGCGITGLYNAMVSPGCSKVDVDYETIKQNFGAPVGISTDSTTGVRTETYKKGNTVIMLKLKDNQLIWYDCKTN